MHTRYLVDHHALQLDFIALIARNALEPRHTLGDQVELLVQHFIVSLQLRQPQLHV